MFGQAGAPQVGKTKVVTTQNTGLSVEHWADRATEKIIEVAPDSESILKDQAEAYREHIRAVLVYYISQAIKSDRTTLYNLFAKQGHRDMAEILRKL